MSAIALAHMGDAVYETLVRTWLCVHGTATGKDLHRATIALVCAPAQAEKMQKVLPLLTDEEQAVYKRGRNANVHTMSRSATPAQYHSATGLECLMGYLYLKGDKNRAEELFRAMMEETWMPYACKLWWRSFRPLSPAAVSRRYSSLPAIRWCCCSAAAAASCCPPEGGSLACT